MKGEQIALLSVEELIRELNAEKEESECTTNKFKQKAKLVDKMETLSIKK